LTKKTKEEKQPLGKRVTVARVGSGEDVPAYKAFPSDATVSDVLSAFEIELVKGEGLSINGTPVKKDHQPYDEECIYISPASTGQ